MLTPPNRRTTRRPHRRPQRTNRLPTLHNTHHDLLHHQVLRQPIESALAAAVGVEYHTPHLAAAGSDRFAQRVSDERCFHVRCHRDTNNSAGRQVQDERQVQEPLPGSDVGYVANPGFIRPSSAEVARQQVRDPMSGVRCGGDTPLAGNETRHTVAFHQPLHPFVIHHQPTPTQLGAHPWRTIGPIRVRPDGPDLVHQGGLGQLRRSHRRLLLVGVVRRRGHPHHRTDKPHREPIGLLSVDETIQHHSFDSLTQKATARFKSSRSIRSRAFSRSSSRSRSRSPDVSPSRSPRLIPS